jgi:D-aminopeptidase
MHPTKACEKIRAATKAAIEARAKIKPIRLGPPLTLDAELVSTQMADLLERMVACERVDGRNVRVKADDMLTLFRHFLTMMTMAGTVYN